MLRRTLLQGFRWWMGVLASVALSAHAGGSVALSDLKPLLAQQPAVADWLASSLKLPDSAFAEVRLGNHFKHLGGARTGPYVFKAALKSGKGELQVAVCTTKRFLDKAGKPLPEEKLTDAVRVDEKLVAVMAGQGGDPPRCPE